MVLELANGEPVAGSLRAGDGRERRFSGWMELVATLQSVLEDPERTSSTEGAPHDPH